MKFFKHVSHVMLVCGIALPTAVAAADWPDAPIRLVVPFAAGGATDILARVIGAKLQQRLGQSVVIENMTGAGGTIGATAVARSRPDGHTLLLGTVATQAISASVYPNLSYGPKDFAPISTVATVPMVLTVHPSIPVDSAAELVTYAKEHPGTLEFGSSGNGAITHLAVEQFKSMAGIDLVHIPYRGSAPAVADLLAGRIKMMVDHIPTVLPHIESGKLKAVGVADPAPLSRLPNVPSITASGVPGYEVSSWFGVLAPAGTPEPIVTRLNSEIRDILALPDVEQTIVDQGAQVRYSRPDEFARIIEDDTRKWGDVVSSAGVKL